MAEDEGSPPEEEGNFNRELSAGGLKQTQQKGVIVCIAICSVTRSSTGKNR